MHDKAKVFHQFVNKELSISKLALLVLLLTIFYVTLARLSLSISSSYVSVTNVAFVANGLAMSFVVLWGYRIAIGVLIAHIILAYIVGYSTVFGIIIGMSDATLVSLGAYLFYRFGISKKFDVPRDIFLFTLISLLIFAPISASVATASIYFIEKSFIDISHAVGVWLDWWIGNALGVLLFTPLIISWLYQKIDDIKIDKKDYIITAIVVIFVILLFISKIEQRLIIFFSLIYPILIWLGIKIGIRAIAIINIIIVAIATYIGVNGSSFMCNLAVADRLFYISVATTSLVFTSMFIFSLLAERNRLILKLQILADKDALTGANNRRSFEELTVKALDYTSRHSEMASLAILDIDFFKKINDTYGHYMGDIVLKEYVKGINSQLRASDILGRIGGEEFAIYFPKTTADRAKDVLERVQNYFKINSIKYDNIAEIFITFSAGVVEIKSDETLEELTKKADEALYLAKESGRDRVIIAG